MTELDSNRIRAGRLWTFVTFSILCLALVGYLVGIGRNAMLPLRGAFEKSDDVAELSKVTSTDIETVPVVSILPAVSYRNIPEQLAGPTKVRSLKVDSVALAYNDLFTEITPSEVDKNRSLQERSKRRAYNGAPPSIPHRTEGTSEQACMACHGNGANIGGLIANRLSHPFMANCLQCHAPLAPTGLESSSKLHESTFVGLAAPTSGQRAYAGAPPRIPHSTWMRQNCEACHRLGTRWTGLESTHPWRSHCLQCHATQPSLEQAVTAATPQP